MNHRTGLDRSQTLLLPERLEDYVPPKSRCTRNQASRTITREANEHLMEAMAQRLAAQSLWHSKDYLDESFRRWKARLGTPKAITAMAHKLARIIWHLIKYRTPYDPTVWAQAEARLKQKKLKYLQQNAAALGYQLLCSS